MVTPRWSVVDEGTAEVVVERRSAGAPPFELSLAQAVATPVAMTARIVRSRAGWRAMATTVGADDVRSVKRRRAVGGVSTCETVAMPERDLSTYSGVEVEPVYGPPDAERPGEWPYTRGPYASMYRSKLWTMRMFAGFGTPIDTNRRFKELLAAGGDGLSTAFDLPTLMGRDSDDPLALGEVGKCGVAVDTLADVEDLYRDIDLGAVTTSMTINSPAPILLAMYVGRGRARRRRRGPGSAARCRTTSSRSTRRRRSSSSRRARACGS